VLGLTDSMKILLAFDI